MTTIDSYRTLLIDELRELYDAEQHLTRALAGLVLSATDPDLVATLESNLLEADEHVARLEHIFFKLDVTPLARPCAGFRALVDDSERHASAPFDSDSLRDATIVGAARQLAHYEIAAYSTAIGHADVLAIDEVTQDLDATLVDHISVERHLREIADTLAAPLTPRPDEPDAHDTNADVSPR
jgi:ferritin-like metal-binding protein YciE